MTKKKVNFQQASTVFYFNASFAKLQELAGERSMVILTDENVHAAHKRRFIRYDTIVIPAGEAYKQQDTVDLVIEQLIAHGADRKTLLVGVGGGVVTDIAGYVASVYMRGIDVGFVPTTLLAMVDAAIGGKNGVDVGPYKNLVGTIRQPEFLLYDYALLKTLPEAEWINGMAEVIKHAAIKDSGMFRLLQQSNLKQLMRKRDLQQKLIMRNALIKIKIVQQDEYEQGDRKLLNFGHTLGHAIENMLQLPHGKAIAVGMVYAAHLSARLTKYKQGAALIDLLEQYELPTHAAFDMEAALQMLQMDKKRVSNQISYVLLQRNGKALWQQLPLDEVKTMLLETADAGA
jgi:3-dehydroquinate synthase